MKQDSKHSSRDALDQALARRLGGIEVADGAPSWAEFSAQRAAVAPVRGVRWWMRGAAVAAVLVMGMVGLGGYLLGWYDGVEQQALELADAKLHVESHPEGRLEFRPEPLPTTTSTHRAIKVQLSATESTYPIEPVDLLVEDRITPTKLLDQSEPERPVEPKKEEPRRAPNAYAGVMAEAAPIRRSKREPIRVGAYAALGSSGAANSINSSRQLLAAEMDYTVGKYQGQIAFTPEQMKHDFPVTVGVSVDIPLVERLRLSTGLLYTYIHSSASTTMGADYNYDYQTHYLGVPISVAYDFLVTRPVDLYVTGGAAVELALASIERSEVRAAGGALISEKTQPVDTRGVMVSFNVGLGVNVRLSPRVGLYAEPGVTSYLSNDSHPINFRTATPLQFSLRAGIRVKL